MKQRALRESQLLGRNSLGRIVTAPAFEVSVAVAIVANGLLLAAEAQYVGFNLAEYTGHASADGHSAEVWPHASEVFDVLHWVFGVIFTIEIILKIAGLRREFAYDAWNWIDLTIVLFWLCGVIGQFGVHVQFLRLARLARLLRLLRIVQFMQGHLTESLFIISTSLKDSVSTTGWSFLFLLVVHFLLALFLNQILSEFYFVSGPSDDTDQSMVFEYFGSFSRSFLTMYEITFGNWPTPIRVLTEHVDEIFLVYGVVHKTILGFAAIGVLSAVFIQETFKVAQMDDNLMVRQTMRRERMHSLKMRRLFEEADEDGNGSIDTDEWDAVCKDEWVQTWLRSQDIPIQDARSLFEIIGDGDGGLTADELIQGTAALKGASAIINLLLLVRGVNESVNEIKERLLVARRAVNKKHCVATL